MFIFSLKKKYFGGIMHQPYWLGRMNHITRIKRLADYPAYKPYSQTTWIFWDIIN
jgi:hypothetical protein